MTPQEFNALVEKIIEALNSSSLVSNASDGVPADDEGTLPEIYLAVDGVDLCLTAAPL